MKRPVVGLGLDGILCDLPGGIINYLQEKEVLPKDSTTEDIVDLDLEKSFPETVTSAIINDMFCSQEFWENLKPYPWVASCVRLLSDEGAVVHIIADRCWFDSLSEVTDRWLYTNGIYFDRIAIIPNTRKAAYATLFNIDYFVDVDMQAAISVAPTVGTSFIVAQPYNEKQPKELPVNCFRTHWFSIMAALRSAIRLDMNTDSLSAVSY